MIITIYTIPIKMSWTISVNEPIFISVPFNAFLSNEFNIIDLIDQFVLLKI